MKVREKHKPFTNGLSSENAKSIAQRECDAAYNTIIVDDYDNDEALSPEAVEHYRKWMEEPIFPQGKDRSQHLSTL